MANRQFVSFPFTDLYKIKQQVLNWSARFSTCCFFDNHQYPSELPGYECLAAVGERARLEASAGNAFEQLKEFSQAQDDWLFGHFSFDLKSETEQSPSLLPDFIRFPDLFFFVPEDHSSKSTMKSRSVYSGTITRKFWMKLKRKNGQRSTANGQRSSLFVIQLFKTGFPKQTIFRLYSSCASISYGAIVMKLISARNFLLKMPIWIP